MKEFSEELTKTAAFWNRWKKKINVSEAPKAVEEAAEKAKKIESTEKELAEAAKKTKGWKKVYWGATYPVRLSGKILEGIGRSFAETPGRSLLAAFGAYSLYKLLQARRKGSTAPSDYLTAGGE